MHVQAAHMLNIYHLADSNKVVSRPAAHCTRSVRYKGHAFIKEITTFTKQLIGYASLHSSSLDLTMSLIKDTAYNTVAVQFISTVMSSRN